MAVVGFHGRGADHISGFSALKDVRVGQAISWAVDRSQVLRVATAGFGRLTAPATAPMKAWQLPEEQWLRYYKPDGSLMWEGPEDTFIKFDNERQSYATGSGWAQPGSWKVGFR